MTTKSGIYYEERTCPGIPDGTPLILLHGNGESLEIYKDFLEYIPVARAVLIDTRGHGKSKGDISRTDFYDFADDVLEVMDEAGIERADILGFSDGGNTAIHFALKYPARLQKAVIIGSNLNSRGMTFLARAGIALTYCFSRLFAFTQKNARRAKLYRLMHKEPRLNYSDLTKIQAPFLVMAGGRDMIKRTHTEKLAAHIKNSRLYIADKGAHFFLFRYDYSTVEAIKEFLMNGG